MAETLLGGVGERSESMALEGFRPVTEGRRPAVNWLFVKGGQRSCRAQGQARRRGVFFEMSSKLFSVCLVLATLSLCYPIPASAKETPISGRMWYYWNLSALVDSQLALTVMPGLRAELSRSDSDPHGRYMDELFLGPTYIRRWDNLSLRIAFWYYFTGFPQRDTGGYTYTHSIELIPVVSYSWNRLTATSRTIFHNTAYASTYDSPFLNNGYSLLIREMIQVSYRLTPLLTLAAAEEIFIGLIEDSEAPPAPDGFAAQGVGLNRVYVGLDINLISELKFSPRYVYEVGLDSGRVTKVGHYFFLTATSVFDLTK